MLDSAVIIIEIINNNGDWVVVHQFIRYINFQQRKGKKIIQILNN